MTTRHLLQLTLALALVGSAGTVGYSDSHSEAKPAAAIPTTPAGLLTFFVGDWTTAGEFYLGGQTIPFPGTAKFATVMNNNYVQQDFDANTGGQAFKGRGLMAYNADKKVWQNSWIDSQSATIDFFDSTYDEKSKTWTGSFESKSAMGHFQIRSTLTINAHDKLTMVHYRTAKTEGAKEEKGMQIIYTRNAK